MSVPTRPKIVITGVGVVSPNGIGREAFAASLRAGRSGIRHLEGIDLKNLKTTAVGQIQNLDLTTVMDTAELRRVPRMVPFALHASREAIVQAGVDEWLAAEPIQRQRQIGVCLGTGGGGLVFVEEQCRQYYTSGSASLFSIIAGTHGNLSSELSIALKLRGPSHVISTGCTSGTDAIGHAAMMIRSGMCQIMLAGGADAPISHGSLHAFEKMRVISTRRWDDPARASRPFSADRDGFVLSEGAWMFVVEDAAHAAARGATPLVELAGYGSTCDAYHRVQIDPQVAEPVRAMEAALHDAGASKDAVNYINLHGTGTDLNDRMETAAIKKCFGARAGKIPMSSTKSMIGHPQGASGAAGVSATIIAMREGVLHPTINLDEPDPNCDLDYIPAAARLARVELALCNCIAFGSKNSTLALRQI